MCLKERDCMKMDKERVSLTSGVFYCETKKERKKWFQEKQTNKNIFLNNSNWTATISTLCCESCLDYEWILIIVNYGIIFFEIWQ